MTNRQHSIKTGKKLEREPFFINFCPPENIEYNNEELKYGHETPKSLSSGL